MIKTFARVVNLFLLKGE